MEKKYLVILTTCFTAFCLAFYYYNNSEEEFVPVKFSIIHSSNLRGETEPCG
tara:strand:+ start:1082 stop:1237 length:156 start_codon:yes stop_codon:yes gene_type:complete